MVPKKSLSKKYKWSTKGQEVVTKQWPSNKHGKGAALFTLSFALCAIGVRADKIADLDKLDKWHNLIWRPVSTFSAFAKLVTWWKPWKLDITIINPLRTYSYFVCCDLFCLTTHFGLYHIETSKLVTDWAESLTTSRLRGNFGYRLRYILFCTDMVQNVFAWVWE